MKFTVEIELGNEEMQGYHDIFEAIRNIQITSLGIKPGHGEVIRDRNGNTVGKWTVIDERACAVCGVSAPVHGDWNVNDPSTHLWRQK